MRYLALLLAALSALLAACSQPAAAPRTGLTEIDKLRPLHATLGEPRPGEWLAEHDEDGQTFEEYLRCDPTLPQGERSKLYVQPIGTFAGAQKRILDDTVEYLALCYGLEVVVRDALSVSEIPEAARRKHPSWGMEQLFTGYILEEVLIPSLPKDAAAYLALTDVDLWPGRGWNFVFGQAHLEERVGVWSVNRNGDPGESDRAYRQCLLRSLKTAAHETGHMFSILHCTAYECLMGGRNNMEESDASPLWMCPECVSKVAWATPSVMETRYEQLRAFCLKRGLDDEGAFFEASLTALR